MWCITKSLFFCHIDLKPLGFGGSQNGTICAGSPKDSSSHWGSSPHGFIIRVGYSRFHWNIASLLFTWPFESFQGHQVDYIKLIISPITSRYYITKTPSYIIFLLPIYHFLLYANTKMSFLFGHFSGCMWSIPRATTVDQWGPAPPRNLGVMPHAETQQHGQNACGLGTAELKENGGFDNGFQSAKMGIYIYIYLKYIVI